MKVKCLIENKIYQMEEKMILKGIFDLVRNNYKKSDRHAIYAVKIGDTYDLKRQEYKTRNETREKAMEYVRRGYEVFWI